MYMTAIPELTPTRAATAGPSYISLCEGGSSRDCARAQRADRDVAFLEHLAEPIAYLKNRTIYYQGDAPQNCFRVVSGTVRICRITEDGRRQIAAFQTRGDLFGWFDQGPYRYSAEAVTDVVLERYRRERFDRFLALHPAESRRLLRSLSGQLAIAQEHTMVLGRLTAIERLASLLLDLARRQGSVTGAASITVAVPMSRKDIADYLGLTIETVSRTMSALKARGVISFRTTRNVRLNEPAVLERYASAARSSAVLETV
jgi:CRP-like cAMP-binding protein